MILSGCGHTFCDYCVQFQLTANQQQARKCPECREWTPEQAIKPNKKVIAIMEINKKDPSPEEDEANNRLELASVKSQAVLPPNKSTKSELTD